MIFRQHKHYFTAMFLLVLIMFACTNNTERQLKGESHNTADTSYFPTDTLRVATMYGATSYFIHQGTEMGFDYELVRDFAAQKGLSLSVTLANTDDEMFALLRNHQVDMIIYNTFETKTLKSEFDFVFPQKPSYLALIQLVSNDAVSNITELNGKEIWVKKNSIHHQRLKDLNEEIGGGITIKLANDSLSTDDLMDMIIGKQIAFTLEYKHKARLQRKYNRRLDTHMAVGFNQHNGWLVRKQNKTLRNSLLDWQKQDNTINLIRLLNKTYWDNNLYFAYKRLRIPKGAISPYDVIFKSNAKRIDWDWRLLVAIAYAESGFENTATSWVGARGVMQLMPTTAMEFGVDTSEIEDPTQNIYAGTEYIKSLNMIYRKIKDKEERIKFILASYNSGPAPILDAMALAKAYGKNSHIWFGNVETFLTKLADPQYYNDPVVKYGRFRGAKETTQFVPYVLETYHRYLDRR